jgi:hypothetical protein
MAKAPRSADDPPSSAPGRRPRILFLFNHDAAHQAAHIAGIAGVLALAGEADVIAAYATPGIRRVVEAAVPAGAAGAIAWVPLDLPRWLDALLAPVNRIAPVRRVARLYRHLDLFAGVDLVVSTERTCLRVKRRLGAGSPKFVYVPHGSGDRNVAYHPELAQFDLMLLSGQKLVDEMAAHGIAPPDRCRIIGYPKFDVVDSGKRQRFFANDNPVFLYNPHFDPRLSSWYDMGEQVMAFFARHVDRYNLIVAPHVMLFRKKLHYSLEYRCLRRRPDIAERYRSMAHILVDLDSPRLFDMSYTLTADVYIGDVSSQVYEFLLHRGACFFLDTVGASAVGGSPAYEFWENGDVCRDAAQLTALLPDWAARAAHFRATQDRLFARTIDQRPDQPATARGARALLAYCRERGAAG